MVDMGAALDEVPAPTLLTVPEAARRLAISERTCWALILSGELPSVHVRHRLRRVSASDLAAYVHQHRITVPLHARGEGIVDELRAQR
jgi:excisionase family DNA binding protein